MARTLEDLKAILWRNFEAAAEAQSQYKNPLHSNETRDNYASPANYAIQNREAMAHLAEAIIAVEREQREAAREKELAQREKDSGIDKSSFRRAKLP